MNCPICSTRLFEQSIVKYRDHGGVKIVGREMFCPNRRCNYQEEW